MTRRQHFFRSGLMLVLALVGVSCGDGGAADNVTSTDSDLLRRGTVFPNGRVRVCWELAGNGANKASDNPNFANLSFWVRDTVENAWGRLSGVTFTDWTDCPTADFTQLQGWVAIHFESCNGGSSSIGFQSGQWTRMKLDDTCPTGVSPSFNEFDFRSEALHEFGHALGFDHEINRDDGPATCSGFTYPIIPGGDKLMTSKDEGSIMNYSYCPAAVGTARTYNRLSGWDVVGVDTAYGIKHSGALVGIGGRCLNVPNASPTPGTPLQIYTCTNVANDRWTRTGNGNLNVTLGRTVRSLNVPNGQVNPNSGTTITIWNDIESSPNEHFEFLGESVLLRTLGDLCIVADSNTIHSQLRTVTCGPNQFQNWVWEKIGTTAQNNRFRLADTSLCINVPNGTAVAGEALQLYPCGSPAFGNELFTTTTRGEIKTLANPTSMCLATSSDSPTEGLAIVSAVCGGSSANRNHRFNVSGQIVWSQDHSQCLDVAGGVSYDGAPVQLYPCVSGAPNQRWDYYFR